MRRGTHIGNSTFMKLITYTFIVTSIIYWCRACHAARYIHWELYIQGPLSRGVTFFHGVWAPLVVQVCISAHTVTNCNTLQRAATLEHITTHCNTFVFSLGMGSSGRTGVHLRTHCNKLQHTATNCNTGTHYNTLQHIRFFMGYGLLWSYRCASPHTL